MSRYRADRSTVTFLDAQGRDVCTYRIEAAVGVAQAHRAAGHSALAADLEAAIADARAMADPSPSRIRTAA